MAGDLHGCSPQPVRCAPWERGIAVRASAGRPVIETPLPHRPAPTGLAMMRAVTQHAQTRSGATQTTPPELGDPPAAGQTTPIDRPEPAATPEAFGAAPRSWTPTMRGRRGRGLRIAARSLMPPLRSGTSEGSAGFIVRSLRSLTALTAVAAVALTGAGWNYMRATDRGFTKVQALDTGSHDIVDPIGQLGDENFLIAGTDSRAGANSRVGAGTIADAEGARSDTVMLVNIPASRERVVAVSFPRDLDVTRPVCEGWNNEKAQYTGVKFPSAPGDKLNATYALGGPKCLTKVLQKLSGLKINHFIGLDFSGFESMVDTVGGVEVCTTAPIIDGQLGTVLSDTGRQVLAGATALDYVRARHVIGEERSDYDRIHRQQLFLSSLLRGALSNRVLFDPGKLDGFISAFTGHAFMDNTGTQDLLMLGRSLQKVAAGKITFLTVPTAGTTTYGNEIPRESDIKAIFGAIIDDQPLPGERRTPEPVQVREPPPSRAPTAVDPTTVSVQISNASATSGLAASTATRLAKPGFQIYSVDTFPRGTVTTTVVRYSPAHREAAATVAAAIPGAKLQLTPGLGSIVQVVLGTDFSWSAAGAVHAPPPFGSPLPEVASVPAAKADEGNSITLPADLEHVNAADDSCR